MLRPADSLPAVPICPGEITFPRTFFVVPRVSLARSSLMRPLLMCPTNALNSRAQDLCPITRAPISHALLAHAPRRTALTSAEMSPARESGSGRPAGQWNTAGLWNATGAWNTLGAWNIAVRTRGVFTHRDDFQKPACVERGLVRTARSWHGRTGAGEGWKERRGLERAGTRRRKRGLVRERGETKR